MYRDKNEMEHLFTNFIYAGPENLIPTNPHDPPMIQEGSSGSTLNITLPTLGESEIDTCEQHKTESALSGGVQSEVAGKQDSDREQEALRNGEIFIAVEPVNDDKFEIKTRANESDVRGGPKSDVRVEN